MAAASSTPDTITIDVTKDLKSLSDLRSFFTGQRAAIFSIGSEMARFAGQPVRSAVGSTATKLTVQGEPKWTMKSGICLSLGADASCTIAICNTSTTFCVSENIDSKDTTNVVAGPTAGMVYINIDMDFDIKGNVSGSWNRERHWNCRKGFGIEVRDLLLLPTDQR